MSLHESLVQHVSHIDFLDKTKFASCSWDGTIKLVSCDSVGTPQVMT